MKYYYNASQKADDNNHPKYELTFPSMAVMAAEASSDDV